MCGYLYILNTPSRRSTAVSLVLNECLLLPTLISGVGDASFSRCVDALRADRADYVIRVNCTYRLEKYVVGDSRGAYRVVVSSVKSFRLVKPRLLKEAVASRCSSQSFLLSNYDSVLDVIKDLAPVSYPYFDCWVVTTSKVLYVNERTYRDYEDYLSRVPPRRLLWSRRRFLIIT